MSSTVFCAEIYPEQGLRRFVLILGSSVILAGAIAIVLATVPVWTKVPALAIWVLLSRHETVKLRRGWQGCRGMRFLGDGDIEVRGSSGNWVPARLLDGSVLLRRYGWLRLVTDDGTHIQELVSGRCRQSGDWRRLHVIWRHI